LLVASGDGEVKLWDIEQDIVVKTFVHNGTSLIGSKLRFIQPDLISRRSDCHCFGGKTLGICL
jgi:hypothetical protein